MFRDWIQKLFPPPAPPDPNAPPPEPKPGVPVTIGPAWLGYLKWAVWLAATVAAIGTFVIQWQRDGRPGPLPDLPPLPPREVVPVGQGWVSDPDAVDAVLGGLPEGERYFADTPAGRAVLGPEEDVYLWAAARQVTGSLLPANNQGSVGSCVGFGYKRAVDTLQCEQIARTGTGGFKPVSPEVIYGGSRVEVGGGRIRGDGSVGAWAAKWVKDWGVVSQEAHGPHDLTAYSEPRARLWGSRGVPDELEPLARESPVQGVALVRTAAECVRALRQGYPVVVCSDQGFDMRRGGDGFARPSGQWMHCMCIDGYTHSPRRGFHIENSWGPNAHTGPTGKGDPGTGGFWADFSVVDRMLSQGDSFALSNAKGWPARKLDWFAHARPPQPSRHADPFAFAIAP